jgi:GT2 family glycosyltransferase
MPDLSIIIVNYRSSLLVVESIRTVKHFNDGLNYEIIVVDNASGDGSREYIQKQFPEVKWIEMGYNAGFARANNQGMMQAKGNVFLLLNPDTISIDNSISGCYLKLSSSDYVASGVQQLNADGTPQISGNYFIKGGINHLLPIPYWGGFLRWLGYQVKTKIPNVPVAASFEEVDWISGAFLMVKRTSVEQAGMMDEDFFLYAEEVEWCSRLRKIGRLCIFGDFKIIHLESGSIDKAHQITEKGYYNLYDKKGLQLMVSNHLRVRKQFGLGWYLFLLLNYSGGVVVFIIASFLHRLFTYRNPFGDWIRAGKFGKNVLRLWMLAPKMFANKPHFYKVLN